MVAKPTGVLVFFGEMYPIGDTLNSRPCIERCKYLELLAQRLWRPLADLPTNFRQFPKPLVRISDTHSQTCRQNLFTEHLWRVWAH